MISQLASFYVLSKVGTRSHGTEACVIGGFAQCKKESKNGDLLLFNPEPSLKHNYQ